jgi:hypothetical protein
LLQLYACYVINAPSLSIRRDSGRPEIYSLLCTWLADSRNHNKKKRKKKPRTQIPCMHSCLLEKMEIPGIINGSAEMAITVFLGN